MVKQDKQYGLKLGNGDSLHYFDYVCIFEIFIDKFKKGKKINTYTRKTYTIEIHWYFAKDCQGVFQGKEGPKNISGLITL